MVEKLEGEIAGNVQNSPQEGENFSWNSLVLSQEFTL